MDYLVVFAGMLLIWVGIVKKRRGVEAQYPVVEEVGSRKDSEVTEELVAKVNSELEDMNYRVSMVEKSFFEGLMAWKTEREEMLSRMEEMQVQKHKEEDMGIEKEEDSKERKPIPENVRVVLEYEREGMSIGEIAKIIGVPKGEVLLLKSLAKHFKD